MRSTYYGWFHGGIVDGAVTGRDGYPPVPKDPIPASLQTELLADLDLRQLLNLGDYKVVMHDKPLESRTVRATPGRLTDSTSPCYAELIGDDVFYQEDVFSGRYLKSLIRFRAFGPGNEPIRTFSTWTESRLAVFPPKEASANESALAELRMAYSNNIKSFAAFLSKPAKKKR